MEREISVITVRLLLAERGQTTGIMILLSRHKVEREERFPFVEECVSILPMIAKQSMASQQMRAAPGEPRRGEIPVELVSSQSFDDFPSTNCTCVLWAQSPGCRGQIGVTYFLGG